VNASREAVRRLQIEKQGIGAYPVKAGKEEIFRAVDALGCIQIDTINVVERAHYLSIWTRLGRYSKGDLDDLAYVDRRLWEHWGHAASMMPFTDYRYFIRSMRIRGEDWAGGRGWFGDSGVKLIDHVLQRIREEGPLSSKDFEEPGRRPQESFQRYYDLAERVIPPWVDTTEPTEEERVSFFVARTMRALGAIKPRDIRGYYHQWCTKIGKETKELQAILDAMAAGGEAVKVTVDGEGQPYYCAEEDAGRLQELAGGFGFDGVRFVTYFDSLMWLRDRVVNLFGFEPALEVYAKPERRRFGYYHLPILYGDRLVGRVAPKLDRRNRVLIVRGLWHEPWFRPDEGYEDKFKGTLEGFAEFNGAEKIIYPP
jgi:uncharacterized protein YcaQ